MVSLIFGAKVPYVIRSSSKIEFESPAHLHQLVCEAYIYGVIDGEAMQVEGLESQLFMLE